MAVEAASPPRLAASEVGRCAEGLCGHRREELDEARRKIRTGASGDWLEQAVW